MSRTLYMRLGAPARSRTAPARTVLAGPPAQAATAAHPGGPGGRVPPASQLVQPGRQLRRLKVHLDRGPIPPAGLLAVAPGGVGGPDGVLEAMTLDGPTIAHHDPEAKDLPVPVASRVRSSSTRAESSGAPGVHIAGIASTPNLRVGGLDGQRRAGDLQVQVRISAGWVHWSPRPSV
ncbi:exported hypothetical protein [Frankia sp. Hr75.2]|nr:exported hypothetical protein [Frankia sp. Hr75.2]